MEFGDEASKAYYDNIKEALYSKNPANLVFLCTSMSEEEAELLISKWNDVYERTMAKIRLSQDASYEQEIAYNILSEIFYKYPLSGDKPKQY